MLTPNIHHQKQGINLIIAVNLIVLTLFAIALASIRQIGSFDQPASIGMGVVLWGITFATLVGSFILILHKTGKQLADAEIIRKTLEHDLSKVKEELQKSQQTAENLHKERDEANEASQLKSEFLANMSHEIRTPMTGVLGMADLLSDTKLSEEQNGFVRTIRNSGESLLTIINDILDFSKIESGKLEMESIPFDLRRCIEETLELVAHKAYKNGVEVVLDFKSSAPEWIHGDVTRIKQITTNLLSNAVKFTSKGDICVTISATQQDEDYLIQFAVKDSGIGIPKNRLNRLFQSFSQVDSSTSRRFGGTGLGLVISKRLSEMMGGTMWVESKENVGSTFYFTIQASPANSEKIANYGALKEIVKGKTALLILQNRSNRSVVSSFLESWEIEYDSPKSIGEGVALYQAKPQKYDFILTEYPSDAQDGAAFIQSINRMSTKRPPIFLFTTILSVQTKEQIKHLNIENHLYKPIKKIPLFISLTSYFQTPNPLEKKKNVVVIEPKILVGESHPLKILLAEDNVVNQKVATRTLSRLGYEIEFVGNGLEAVKAVQKKPFDLVLMDIHMPEMDGIEATQMIQQLESTRLPKRPQIYALTAGVMESERESCIAAGMHGFITKPFKASDIVPVLKNVFSLQKI